MIFRQLMDYDTNTYTYLLASGIGREAIIIDPVRAQVDSYIQLINELDLKLVAALDTHVHADHITGIGKLNEQTQCLSVMGTHSRADCVSLKLEEDETFDFDGISLRALYTPGHTDDSYSFVVDDYVFTGDTLLIRGTGRTDFQNGDPYALYDSIVNKLFKLDEDTKVYPAHDYNGRTSSTIYEEKRFNPRLQVPSVIEFVEIMNNLNLADPKYIDIAIPANLKCGLNLE